MQKLNRSQTKCEHEITILKVTTYERQNNVKAPPTGEWSDT